MKKLFLTIALLLGLATLWAQVPQQFHYQAVVRDSRNGLVQNRTVAVRLSILRGSAQGTAVFTEVRTAQTNAQGLVSIAVGDLTSIDDIDWGNGPYFLKAEVDPAGGSDYTMQTVQQILSVPYALYAGIADSVRGQPFVEKQVLTMGHDTIYLTGGSYVVLPPDFSGDYNDLVGKPTRVSQFTNDAGYITREAQVLRIGHDTVYLTGGSYVKLPPHFSGNYNDLTNKPTALSQFVNDAGFLTREVQALSAGHDTVYLTGGSFVVIPPYVEMQNFADVLALSNSANNRQLKNVQDPTDPQDAVTKRYLDSLWSMLIIDSVADYGTHNTVEVDACDGYTWHGVTYTVPGTYLYDYSNVGGFFSTDTLKLSVRVGTYNSSTATGYGSYDWHGRTYASTGTYLYSYQNLYGCPSVDTLHLTIVAGGGSDCTAFRSESDTATLIVCGRVNWYGTTIRGNGTYEHSLGNVGVGGCDSVVRVRVTIRPMFLSDTAVRTTSAFTWRGRTYNDQGDYSDTIHATVGCDSVWNLHLMMGGDYGIGAAPGLYSVDNGVQVRFAHGNLQYLSSINYWQFAESQYDMLGLACMAGYYPTWSDLFGWGTSGWHNSGDALNTNYMPWAQSNQSAPAGSPAYYQNQYGYGPSSTMPDTNLTGSSRNYDWGQYNPIINGGNGAGLWRLMSEREWDYLLHRRNNAAYLTSLGIITDVPSASGGTHSVMGYIILCDNWTRPTSLNFTPNATSVYDNQYSMAEWKVLEASGAVFLPMKEDGIAFYWTSTSGGSGSAYCLSISENAQTVGAYNRSNPYCVRLVQNNVASARNCICSYFDTTIVSNDVYSWHGYTYTKSGDYMEAIVAQNGCDSIISLSLLINEPGTVGGLFSVSSTKQVLFSKGNLQYKASNNVWRFGNVQYDYCGEGNRNVSYRYRGWIDLFPWATSGYHDSIDLYNRYYRPYDVGGDARRYGPSVNVADWNLVGMSKEYDWGVHNPIANGGNVPGRWRTLLATEWEYLLYLRPHADSLWAPGTVNGVRGIILLPDLWTQPSALYFMSMADLQYDVSLASMYDSNIYTVADWNRMEQAGAVFLPAGGISYGYEPRDVMWACAYWTASLRTNGADNNWTWNARSMLLGWMAEMWCATCGFLMPDLSGLYYSEKSNCMSVRLVRDY
ncbi:MAG: hypothetical protein IJV22_02985 [Bacteroidales bacterium]|nr:hypothetical protein [Bacteroidales bacterium]